MPSMKKILSIFVLIAGRLSENQLKEMVFTLTLSLIMYFMKPTSKEQKKDSDI